MKRQSFVISAIILTLGGFFAKAIGALYKIPLTNILGSSGMGLYYLIFPLYSLAITLCSSGISVALTLEVAKCRKIRHKYNEQKLLRVALVMSFVISLILTMCIILLARPLAEAQGNVNARLGYIVIAPAIIISSIIATLRGYFQGIENMIPTTISMIIEQVVKLSIGLILAHKLCIYGINYAVVGAILGVTCSEVIALIIICINFLIYKGQKHYNYRNLTYKIKRRIPFIFKIKNYEKVNKSKVNNSKYYKCNNERKRYSTSEALLSLVKISVPSMLSTLVLPIATMFDSFMIINLLSSIGFSSHVSTILYGLSGGVVQSLISVPIIIITAISTSLVPSLSGLKASNDTNEMKYRVAFFIKLTWILSLVIFMLIFVFAEDILVFLYGNGLDTSIINELQFATLMLKFSSVSIIYYAFLQTFTSILQSINKAGTPFVIMLIALIIRIVLVRILTVMPNVNIFGSIIANCVFLSVANILLCRVVKNKIDLEYNIYRHLLKPAIICFIILIILEVIRSCLRSVMGIYATMIVLGVIGCAIYVFAVYFGRCFTKREMKYIKLFRKKSKK